jgi:hypothetical protein
MTGSSKTLLPIYQDTMRHLPEDAIFIIILFALCNMCQEQKPK